MTQPIEDNHWSSADYEATKHSGWFFFVDRDPPYFKLSRVDHNEIVQLEHGDSSKQDALSLATKHAMDGNLYAAKALRLYEQRGGIPILLKECPW